jgi:hypothetical protein
MEQLPTETARLDAHARVVGDVWACALYVTSLSRECMSGVLDAGTVDIWTTLYSGSVA